jgi:hypothetical protein
MPQRRARKSGQIQHRQNAQFQQRAAQHLREVEEERLREGVPRQSLRLHLKKNIPDFWYLLFGEEGYATRTDDCDPREFPTYGFRAAPLDNYTPPPGNNDGDGGQNKGNANKDHEPADNKHATTAQDDGGGQHKNSMRSDAIEATSIASNTATKDSSYLSPGEYESNDSSNEADTGSVPSCNLPDRDKRANLHHRVRIN